MSPPTHGKMRSLKGVNSTLLENNLPKQSRTLLVPAPAAPALPPSVSCFPWAQPQQPATPTGAGAMSPQPYLPCHLPHIFPKLLLIQSLELDTSAPPWCLPRDLTQVLTQPPWPQLPLVATELESPHSSWESERLTTHTLPYLKSLKIGEQEKRKNKSKQQLKKKGSNPHITQEA